MNKIFFTILLLTYAFSAIADTRSLEGTWLGLFGRKSYENNYFLWTEAQVRLENEKLINQQLLLRTGVLRKLNDRNEVGLLYAYVQTGLIKEHRPTPQHTYVIKKSDTGLLTLRNRLELRLREDIETDSIRYRGALRYAYKVANETSLVAWEEPFFNLTNEDWTGNRFLERNRAFLGAAFSFEGTSLEVGYMNQFTPRASRDIIEHILLLYYFY